MKHLRFKWHQAGLLLTDYLFPRLCGGCSRSLLSFEEEICQICQANFPFTRMSEEEKEQLLNLFAGRKEVVDLMVCLQFRSRGMVQRMLHQLKYKGRSGLAVQLGKTMGQQLAEAGTLSLVDAVVPVPLHPDKQKKRGYNQSERLAAGLVAGRDLPVMESWLYRAEASGSQTKLGRFNRWQNARAAFQATDHHDLRGSRVLLVDDVLTTGATLDACAEALIERGVAEIRIATLAHGQ